MADSRMYEHGPYRYITKHGIGPGMLPKDVNLVKYEDLDSYRTAIWTDRFLTTDELKEYDIYPETVQESCSDNKKETVFEALTDKDIEDLSKYSLTEDEMSYLLSLLELISDEDKTKAFEYVNAIFSGKKLVDDEEKEETSESLRYTKISENYTRRLLGDIK